MDKECIKCNAKHFSSEVTNRDNDVFTLCCHKGKVVLHPLIQNELFKSLYDGLSSNNVDIKRKSRNYFNNIRQYNSAFAMVSTEAHLSDTFTGGIYHFKIHNIFYHKAGPITAQNGQSPRYAQLYFYDVEEACSYRMQANQSCDDNLMRQISIELNRVNPFVRSFLSMKEYCDRFQNENREVYMVIKVNRELDLRRYNDATQTDVAVIFSTVDGEPPFERNMTSFPKTNGTLRQVSVLDSSLDPLAYPLLYPNGDIGWHPNMCHNTTTTSRARVKTTMLQIEGTRLHYIRQNQNILKAELFNNLADYLELHRNSDLPINVGRRVILPSSFNGSPRNMYQNYLDAMSIVQHFGKPSLFLTMTCNPSWTEITNNIGPHESANFRPELIVRVFKLKLKDLINVISNKCIFGRVEAIIYTIEFQKRGLPHAHILITLHEEDNIVGPTDIDSAVCAEIPDKRTHPKLHEYVVKHMMHSPCGALNLNSVCMRDGKCSKQFPKDFNNITRESVNGYPLYRRRDNGISADVRGSSLDNRYVVPYNPYLLAKFNCHLNVEVCTTVKSVKYIYKYVYKGYDSATIALENQQNENMLLDEVEAFLNVRYVGSTEALWRIYEFPMHYQSHTIIRLDIHLDRQQTVIFREG
ncbi:uncharacterized protein LOC135955598 [Calliphora vicina]|uniref:uncharacterized protein LOC135955598 n=1 Tax=Calliphora vicina TaxID=7373 RepID=UPI00325B67CE